MTLAKIDHIIFKSAGYIAITRGIKTQEFPDHLNCRFGKWYLNAGMEKFSKIPSFNNINAHHKNVHDNVLKALECLKNGTCAKVSDQVLVSFGDVERESAKLFELLDETMDAIVKNSQNTAGK